jgi:hypothetical protein
MVNHNEMNGTVGNKRLIIKEEIKLKIHILNAQSASPVTIYVTKNKSSSGYDSCFLLCSTTFKYSNVYQLL